jgi:hypothetical protein
MSPLFVPELPLADPRDARGRQVSKNFIAKARKSEIAKEFNSGIFALSLYRVFAIFCFGCGQCPRCGDPLPGGRDCGICVHCPVRGWVRFANQVIATRAGRGRKLTVSLSAENTSGAPALSNRTK